MLLLGLMLVLAPASPLMAAAQARPYFEGYQTRETERRIAPYSVRSNGRDYRLPGTTGPTPWIQNGGVLLVPGESLVIDLSEPTLPVALSSAPSHTIISPNQAARLDRLMTAAAASRSAMTDQPGLGAHLAPERVGLTLIQAPESENMLLVVDNGLQSILKYRAEILVPEADGPAWRATTICSVAPGVFGFEHWPQAIIAISLKDFRVLDTAGQQPLTCE